ncbi:9152_t:CDS:10 [Entrophospora sp. SA101]|nr:9152_t:CDS:10 [Entrophospora sp. SA101]
MTVEQAETWISDANQFVADDDDDTFNFSVRVAAEDLLTILMDKFPERTLKSLTAISQHNMAESNKARADGDPNWWQIHEACLKAIGFVSNELISALNDKNLNIGINLGILFEQIIHQILNEPGFPFLRGRAFVFASQFASVLPGELTSGFIKAAIEAIKDPDGTIPVKVSALRALKSFCRNLNEQYVLPFQGTIIECVANLINVTTEDFLLLVLETLERAIKINRDVIFQYEGLIGPMVVDVWQKFPSEHLVMSAVNSISETLSINSTFIERALPALANIIMNPTIDSSHTESAIDLITSLIRGTTISPLPFVYIQHIFPPLIHLMLTTEERSILQSGEICLRYLVQKGCSQISEWTDNIGKSGLSYLIDYIAKSLQPIEGESAAFLGDLVVILIKKAGDKLNPVLPDLLKAVALKLDSAKTTTSIQVLLHKWLEHHDSFTGYYNCKVSSVALTKLFSCGDPRISAIQVKGDLKESNATGFEHLYEEEEDDGAESDDNDDDWEDVEQPSPFTPAENYVISDFLDREQELEDIENDPDIKNDEIYNLKLSEYILHFLLHCKTQNVNNFRQICEQDLNQEERIKLQLID